MKLTPTMLSCGPDVASCKARLDVVVEDGDTIEILLDPAHVRALVARLDEIISGRVMARPPSRRVFNLALFNEIAEETADTLPPPPLAAAGGDRR